jgi:MFS family permease
VVNEFAFQGPFLKLGQNIGLLVGAAFWGIGSDIWGRRYLSNDLWGSSIWNLCTFLVAYRLSFNVTFFITGVFALSAGASPNSITLCSLAAVWSIGVGGNLPVDSAIFLGMSAVIKGQRGCPLMDTTPEFIPASHQYLLTVLSIWWAVGQLLGSLVGPYLFQELPVPHLEYRLRGH